MVVIEEEVSLTAMELFVLLRPTASGVLNSRRDKFRAFDKGSLHMLMLVGADVDGTADINALETAVVGIFVLGSEVVGICMLGAAVVGFSVLGTAVVGFSVLGTAVVGSSVLGTAVVGFSVLGTAVVGFSVLGD